MNLEKHPVTEEMKRRVNKELDRIERKYNVKIIYACESGSRGWGFASTNSDYDVRFIYVNKPSWYVRVDNEARDTIEEPIDSELDISGWNITKTLGLLYKSNPTLLEWLNSPIVYREERKETEQIRHLASCYFVNLSAYMHYISLAKSTWIEWVSNREQVKLKKYFYILRPLLAALWVEKHKSIPPMPFEDLYCMVDSPKLMASIKAAVSAKRASTEKDEIPIIPVLNAFIEKELSKERPKFEDYERPEIQTLSRYAWEVVDDWAEYRPI